MQNCTIFISTVTLQMLNKLDSVSQKKFSLDNF